MQLAHAPAGPHSISIGFPDADDIKRGLWVMPADAVARVSRHQVAFGADATVEDIVGVLRWLDPNIWSNPETPEVFFVARPEGGWPR